MSLVLASGSPVRRTLLANAGLSFEVVPAGIDERAAERPLIDAGVAPAELALALAAVKASVVSGTRPHDLVIGADQVLDLEGERLTKPADMETARQQLLRLCGRTHQLHTAVACARAGEVQWRHVETASLAMRPLRPPEVGRYLARVGPAALESVGAYQLEGIGIQLFDSVDGDYFAILGLPLLPLLRYLRSQGVVE
jgi:septum formation protein